MKASPILFSAPMIRALLEGRKTMTRRVVKPQPDYEIVGGGSCWNDPKTGKRICCPYGQQGDLLWVRETWAPVGACARGGAWYKADTEWPSDPYFDRWKPSIHMPRWASRLTLKLTDVSVERLQDIWEDDAVAEGLYRYEEGDYNGDPDGNDASMNEDTATSAFVHLWDSINAKRGYSWESNPWVWALTFEVIRKNVGEVLRETQ